MVYFEKPVFILFPILLLAWLFFVYCFKKKIKTSAFADIALTSIGAVGHMLAISAILMNGGSLSDVLLLVLLSGALSLFLSPKANLTVNKTDEEDND